MCSGLFETLSLGPSLSPNPCPRANSIFLDVLLLYIHHGFCYFSPSASLIVHYHRSIQNVVNTLFSCLWIRLLAPSLGAAFVWDRAVHRRVLCTWYTHLTFFRLNLVISCHLFISNRPFIFFIYLHYFYISASILLGSHLLDSTPCLKLSCLYPQTSPRTL